MRSENFYSRGADFRNPKFVRFMLGVTMHEKYVTGILPNGVIDAFRQKFRFCLEVAKVRQLGDISTRGNISHDIETPINDPDEATVVWSICEQGVSKRVHW